MFACYTCAYQTNVVTEFANHLQVFHSQPEPDPTGNEDQLPVKEEDSSILPDLSQDNNPNLITTSSNPVLNAIPEDPKCDALVKAEFGTEGDLEDEDRDENDEEFYTGDFEPIIQIQVATEEEQKECADALLQIQKKRKRLKQDSKNPLQIHQSEVEPKEKRKRIIRAPRKLGEEDTAEEPESNRSPKKRGRKKKIGDANVLKREPMKRGPKKKLESEKKHRIYPCDQCLKEFKNNCDLRRHVDSTHLKLKPYQCDQCDSSFALLGNLKKHVTYVHFNLKRVQNKIPCTVCGKIYSSSYCLTIHMRAMHSAEKQFQCEYCGMKFAWKRCYERHISSIHLQLKNFKCETCATMFARKEHLKTHQKRHTREAKVN